MNLYGNAQPLENFVEGSCIRGGSTDDFLHAGEQEIDNVYGCEIRTSEDAVFNNDSSDADTSNNNNNDNNNNMNEDSNDLNCKRTKKRHRTPRLWKDKWQELYPWASLRKVNGEDRMFCTYCETYGSTSTRNAFRLEGSCNFQPSALSTHENSSAHKNACLSQRTWQQTENAMPCDMNRRNGLESNSQGMVQPGFESTVIADHLACISNTLEKVVTREDFYALRTELHIMQRSEDARRINAFCVPTDPLVPVPNLDGTIPDNLPGSLAEMMMLPGDHIEALLMEYKLPIHGSQEAKLRRLKAHLGFRC